MQRRGGCSAHGFPLPPFSQHHNLPLNLGIAISIIWTEGQSEPVNPAHGELLWSKVKTLQHPAFPPWPRAEYVVFSALTFFAGAWAWSRKARHPVW